MLRCVVGALSWGRTGCPLRATRWASVAWISHQTLDRGSPALLAAVRNPRGAAGYLSDPGHDHLQQQPLTSWVRTSRLYLGLVLETAMRSDEVHALQVGNTSCNPPPPGRARVHACPRLRSPSFSSSALRTMAHPSAPLAHPYRRSRRSKTHQGGVRDKGALPSDITIFPNTQLPWFSVPDALRSYLQLRDKVRLTRACGRPASCAQRGVQLMPRCSARSPAGGELQDAAAAAVHELQRQAQRP